MTALRRPGKAAKQSRVARRARTALESRPRTGTHWTPPTRHSRSHAPTARATCWGPGASPCTLCAQVGHVLNPGSMVGRLTHAREVHPSDRTGRTSGSGFSFDLLSLSIDLVGETRAQRREGRRIQPFCFGFEKLGERMLQPPFPSPSKGLRRVAHARRRQTTSTAS
jgi:hypothetical protein